MLTVITIQLIRWILFVQMIFENWFYFFDRRKSEKMNLLPQIEHRQKKKIMKIQTQFSISYFFPACWECRSQLFFRLMKEKKNIFLIDTKTEIERKIGLSKFLQFIYVCIIYIYKYAKHETSNMLEKRFVFFTRNSL